jgi:hypothetical protein
LLISTCFVTAVNVNYVREDFNKKMRDRYEAIINGGIIQWLVNLILSIIELIKRPFINLKEKFERLADLYNNLVILMTDIIELIDWCVKRAIIGVKLTIIWMLLDFIIDLLVHYGIIEPLYNT